MTYSCSDFTDSVIEKLKGDILDLRIRDIIEGQDRHFANAVFLKLKLDIPEGFDSPVAQAAIVMEEIGVLQDFALNVRRAIDTCRDDRDFNGLVERIQDLTDKIQDDLHGDTMVEQPAVTFDKVAEVAQ